MAKTYKAISFEDRMHNPKYKVDAKYKLIHDKSIEIYTELDEKTNRVVKKSRSVVSKFDKCKRYKVSDFTMENLTAIGAVGKLVETKYTMSEHAIVDSLSNTAANIVASSSVETNNPNTNPTND